jgi:hypothetical protein
MGILLMSYLKKKHYVGLLMECTTSDYAFILIRAVFILETIINYTQN